MLLYYDFIEYMLNTESNFSSFSYDVKLSANTTNNMYSEYW